MRKYKHIKPNNQRAEINWKKKKYRWLSKHVKKTNTHTKQLENLLTKIPLPLPSDATEKMMKLFETNVDKNMLKDYKPKKNWWHF